MPAAGAADESIDEMMCVGYATNAERSGLIWSGLAWAGAAAAVVVGLMFIDVGHAGLYILAGIAALLCGSCNRLGTSPCWGRTSDQLQIQAFSAAGQDDHATLERLLKQRPSLVSVLGFGGNQLLHVAVVRNNLKAVRVLLGHKANVNALNSEEETPLDLAERFGRKEIADVLEESGAKRATGLGKLGDASETCPGSRRGWPVASLLSSTTS